MFWGTVKPLKKYCQKSFAKVINYNNIKTNDNKEQQQNLQCERWDGTVKGICNEQEISLLTAALKKRYVNSCVKMSLLTVALKRV